MFLFRRMKDRNIGSDKPGSIFIYIQAVPMCVSEIVGDCRPLIFHLFRKNDHRQVAPSVPRVEEDADDCLRQKQAG